LPGFNFYPCKNNRAKPVELFCLLSLDRGAIPLTSTIKSKLNKKTLDILPTKKLELKK